MRDCHCHDGESDGKDRVQKNGSIHRYTLPVKLVCGVCSFQFGRTSILFPRPPHLAQTTRVLKYGISDSAGGAGVSDLCARGSERAAGSICSSEWPPRSVRIPPRNSCDLDATPVPGNPADLLSSTNRKNSWQGEIRMTSPIVLASSRRRFLQYLAGSPLFASGAISEWRPNGTR